MRLKIYNFNNPITKQTEEVYEYPWEYAPQSYFKYCSKGSWLELNLYTKEPMKFPILLIPSKFTKEIPNQRWSIENDFLDLTYYYGKCDGKYD